MSRTKPDLSQPRFKKSFRDDSRLLRSNCPCDIANRASRACELHLRLSHCCAQRRPCGALLPERQFQPRCIPDSDWQSRAYLALTRTLLSKQRKLSWERPCCFLGYRERKKCFKKAEKDQDFGLAFSLAWPFCNSTVYSTALQPYSFCSWVVFCLTNFLNESRFAELFSPVFLRASVSA
jgi:hypothetical protein